MCVSIDATLRIARRIKGQADHRASVQKRAAAPYDDATARRRILTLRGRTGDVAGMWPIREETTTDSTQTPVGILAKMQALHVRFLRTYGPSELLYLTLRAGVFPNLNVMPRDPVHLAIVYMTSHNT